MARFRGIVDAATTYKRRPGKHGQARATPAGRQCRPLTLYFNVHLEMPKKLLTALSGPLLLLCGVNVRAAELPPGFEQTKFVDGLHDPNAMEFAPDGRLFVAERINGQLRVVENGRLLDEPFVTVSVPPELPSKRDEAAQPGFRYQGIYHYGPYRSSGLRGIAFDPDFDQNGHIYLYYMNDSPRVNRVSRFTASRSNPNVADPDSEKVLLDIPMHDHGPEPVHDGGSHNGGALLFGPDGKLYVTVGDGWNPAPRDAPQDLSNLIGKVLRIGRDGAIPDDNPFVDVPGAREEIWALGFRNPYTMARHPETGRIYVNDVAWGKQTVYELIKGGNYQHPSFQGAGRPQDPIHAGAGLIAGGTWYFGDRLPPPYRGSYFLTDWRGNVIRRMISEADRRVVDFATGATQPTIILQGPDEALYWLSTNYETLSGIVYRIDYRPELADRETVDPAEDFDPSEALIGHWPLDDGTGLLARDISGSGRHGRLHGDVQWADEPPGLLFDGRAGHVELGTLDIDTPELTIVAWIRPESFLDGMADNRIISKSTGEAEQDHWWMLSSVRHDGRVRLRFRLKAGGRTYTLIARAGSLNPGVWTHVAATYDGLAMRLFQNGIEVGTRFTIGTPDVQPEVPVWLADNPPEAGSRTFDGRIRDVRIYGRALNANELQALQQQARVAWQQSRQPRTEVVEEFQAALRLAGDASRGRDVFRERCINCHQLDGEGQQLGPDLKTIVASRDKAWLLEAILDPNRNVEPQYWSYTIETADGRLLQGLIVDETDETLTLRQLHGDDQTVRRDQIDMFHRNELSLMPERLEAELSTQDVADLLEYLIADQE